MRDPKFWTDILTAAWLLWIGVKMKTEDNRSAVFLNALPVLLAFLLAMSHAKAIF